MSFTSSASFHEQQNATYTTTSEPLLTVMKIGVNIDDFG